MLIAARTGFGTLRALGLIVFVQACLAVSAANPAAAWGNVGHRAVIIVAERYFTPEAQQEVRRLLALEKSDGLVSIAMWADQIRRMEVPGTPAHDVEIPVNAEGYDAARDCPNFCVVKAIPHYLAILADTSKPDAARLEALKYVAHLVGDVHQPLHASQDGGGELIAWNGKIVYLHILWDVTLLANAYPTPELMAEAIAPLAHPLQSCGTPVEWANESHEITKNFVFRALGPDRKQPIALPEDYEPQALPMIKERLALAAMRLACVLNAALDPDHPWPVGSGTEPAPLQ
jgi:S1/P1 Nuclease